MRNQKPGTTCISCEYKIDAGQYGYLYCLRVDFPIILRFCCRGNNEKVTNPATAKREGTAGLKRVLTSTRFAVPLTHYLFQLPYFFLRFTQNLTTLHQLLHHIVIVIQRTIHLELFNVFTNHFTWFTGNSNQLEQNKCN